MTRSTSRSSVHDELSYRRAIRIWLVVVALMVAATAVIGAATRLTGSGLSITEWAPILGIVPPITEADWQAAFAKYKAIPQYAQLNRGMSLDAFKTIFWWEWAHRLVARSIGAVFLLPFLYFLARRAIPRALTPRLVVLFILGGLQGAIGWYMVSSGLIDRIDVSPYRLSLHLGMAFLILGVTVWTILDLRLSRPEHLLDTLKPGQRTMSVSLLVLTFVQVILGALVAGHKAGRTYNTWPLMDGSLIPDGLFQLDPRYRNLFENIAMVQFNHRIIAYLLMVLAIVHAVRVAGCADDERVRRTSGVLAALVAGQVALGVWTLLAWVPVTLGVAHQVGALAVYVAALAHAHAMYASRA